MVAKSKEPTMSIGQDLVSESGSAFSRFAQEVSIWTIKASMVDIKHQDAESKNTSNTKSSPRTYVDKLLENIQYSGDFPDEELADKIEESSKAFRKDFRLRPV